MSQIKLLKEMKYSLYLILHPFDGFWDLKHEKRGGLGAALIILSLTVITFLLSRRYTGFIFNYTYILNVNFFLELIQILGLFLLFTVANWCLTTLMDGKGTFRDIAIATSYALTPYVMINIPLVLLSNVITFEEGAFYSFFSGLSIAWTIGLLIFGTMITHDYTLSKTMGTIILIILGMFIMVFLGLLLFSIIQKMIGFVFILYKEINFRF